MKKRKTTEIKIFEPMAYWEKKLMIDYEIEFICHKKLCIKKLTRKEKHMIHNTDYITYSKWEQHVTSIITILDESELYEHIHFLRMAANNHHVEFNLSSTFLSPFFISIFMGPYILELVERLINGEGSSTISTTTIIGFFVGIFISFRKWFSRLEDDSLYYSFYTDLAHIAEKRYKELMENEKAKQTQYLAFSKE